MSKPCLVTSLDEQMLRATEFALSKIEEVFMSKPAHTPLPWKVVKNRWGQAVILVGPGGNQHAACIESLLSSESLYDPEELEANARFIAKAVNSHEELLEALAELVNSPNAKQNAMWDRARAAIAKAESS